MVDARQILQPKFSYYKETDNASSLESVILTSHTTDSKQSVRISAGVIENLIDFDLGKPIIYQFLTSIIFEPMSLLRNYFLFIVYD
jgi:hypothetical protein